MQRNPFKSDSVTILLNLYTGIHQFPISLTLLLSVHKICEERMARVWNCGTSKFTGKAYWSFLAFTAGSLEQWGLYAFVPFHLRLTEGLDFYHFMLSNKMNKRKLQNHLLNFFIFVFAYMITMQPQ